MSTHVLRTSNARIFFTPNFRERVVNHILSNVDAMSEADMHNLAADLNSTKPIGSSFVATLTPASCNLLAQLLRDDYIPAFEEMSASSDKKIRRTGDGLLTTCARVLAITDDYNTALTERPEWLAPSARARNVTTRNSTDKLERGMKLIADSFNTELTDALRVAIIALFKRDEAQNDETVDASQDASTDDNNEQPEVQPEQQEEKPKSRKRSRKQREEKRESDDENNETDDEMREPSDDDIKALEKELSALA